MLVLSLLCYFENSVTEETHNSLIKESKYFHVHTTLFAMSDNRKYIKEILTQQRKEKLGINQQNRFQTIGKGSLLNLIKVCITTRGNGSINMNMEKGGITINFTMMTLI